MFGIDLSQSGMLKMAMSALSPKSAFSLMAKHISSELKIDVVKFDINFHVKDKKIFITAYSEKIDGGKMTKPFDKGEQYADLANHYIKDFLPADAKSIEIDVIVINYDEKLDTKAYLFGMIDGEKKSFEYKF